MRHSPSYRRMNSKSGKRSPSPHQGQGQGGKGKSPCSKQENYKQGREIAASVYNNMKTISKKKGKVGEVNLPKALIMSFFEYKDVKKAIRDYVSSVEVVVKVLPPKDI
eukprot:11312222-Ditylum_brightwellii.AAC.1